MNDVSDRGVDLTGPQTLAATAALAVATRFYSPALLHHCLRSYLWAAKYGEAHGIAFDEELLYVSAMLHDLGLTDAFDSHRSDFESSGWKSRVGVRGGGLLVTRAGRTDRGDHRAAHAPRCPRTSTPSPISYRSPPAGTSPGAGLRSSRRSCAR